MGGESNEKFSPYPHMPPNRDTPTAKIFVTKSEHDFRYSMVVSMWTKWLAWLGVFFLNLFFIYFSMLRGLQRGHDWQLMYLTACVIQFSVEVIFYETSECVLIHYVIPDLARNEIHSVQFVLHKAIESLWVDVPGEELLLNAPEYLFVSTQLANAFPHLLDSMVVRSYFSFSPGELSKKWRISHFSMSSPLSVWSWTRGRVRRFTVTALTTAILQYLGACSPTFQRVFIHSMQPLVLSGFYFLLDLLFRQPLFFLPFGSLVLYLLYRVVEGEYRRRSYEETEKGHHEIHPILTPTQENEEPQSSSTPVVMCDLIGGDEKPNEGKETSDLSSGGDGSEEWEVDIDSHLDNSSFVSSSDSGMTPHQDPRVSARVRKSRGYSEDSALFFGSDISSEFLSLQEDEEKEETSGGDEVDGESFSCSSSNGYDLSSDEVQE